MESDWSHVGEWKGSGTMFGAGSARMVGHFDRTRKCAVQDGLSSWRELILVFQSLYDKKL